MLLDMEEELEAATAERDLARCTAVLARADEPGAPKCNPWLVNDAKAMKDKLELFQGCQTAMDAKDVDGLRGKIKEVTSGWWHA